MYVDLGYLCSYNECRWERSCAMFIYKIDILKELKKAGYSSYRLRNEKLINERVIQQIRENEIFGIKPLHTVCKLLNKQPNDIIKYVKD